MCLLSMFKVGDLFKSGDDLEEADIQRVLEAEG